MLTLHIGSDHRGFNLKAAIINWAHQNGYNCIDHGTESADSCDYPDYALAVANAVAQDPTRLGIVICSNGIGVSIAANKVTGIRAALVYSQTVASQCKRHNNANVIALGADEFDASTNLGFVQTYLQAKFEGDRHQRRIDKIARYECER